MVKELDRHHDALVSGIAEQQKLILEKSRQAVYIYLDDAHKTCNRMFASLLGYGSIKEWVDNETPLDDVVEADQDDVVEAYTMASERLEAGTLNVSLRNVKTGSLVKVKVIMAPIVFDGHVMVIHFISRV